MANSQNDASDYGQASTSEVLISLNGASVAANDTPVTVNDTVITITAAVIPARSQ